MRYRLSAGLEFWGVAGCGRGTMTLDAGDEAAANPDIWLSTIGIGGRAALLPSDQSGGLALDLVTDGLFTRIGAEADVPLRDAVEAFVSRLRLGLESSWPRETAGGITLTPTLSTALRYDTGDAETGLGVEVGTGWGAGTADGSSGSSGNAASNSTASTDDMWLEGEIGYGFAAFNGNAVVTPYAGLSLSDGRGRRDWRLGGRISFLPGLDISIEGTRKEQQNAAPDHGVQLDINTAW